MMTVGKFLNCGVDIQVEVHYYYYDYDKDERIEITKKEASDKEMKYMYCENDEIVIEVEMED